MPNENHLVQARAALVRLLTREPSLKHDRAFHLDYIRGYVDLLDKLDEADAYAPLDAQLKLPLDASDGYARGFREAKDTFVE